MDSGRYRIYYGVAAGDWNGAEEARSARRSKRRRQYRVRQCCVDERKQLGLQTLTATLLYGSKAGRLGHMRDDAGG
jgi:hypothetical protein